MKILILSLVAITSLASIVCTLGRRPTLLFDHLPKAGGTSVRKYLKALIGSPIEASKAPAQQKQFPRDSWILVKEFQGLTEEQRKRFFTIGLVREPCSYYLSLWSFGSERKGRVRHALDKIGRSNQFYGRKPPFSSSGDLKRFTKWLKHEKGRLTQRFTHSYGNVSTERADCWVRTGSLASDFKRCIKLFIRAGGWTKMSPDDFVPTVNNPSHHKKCSIYFNAERSALVQTYDAAIYDIFPSFNFSCCNGNK